MSAEGEFPVEARLMQLFWHLGIERAHVAARIPADWSGLTIAYPETIASLALICPTEMPLHSLQSIASRLLMVTGDQGAPAASLRRAAAILPEATMVSLSDYYGHPRADLLADRAEQIGDAMLNFLARHEREHPLKVVAAPAGAGETAGISYRVHGAGAPLVLLPLGLAASQWDPLLPRLTERYSAIVLGGTVLGSVASLEARGRSSGYLSVVRSLIEAMSLQPGDSLLDVGCGTGVLDRWLARRTAGNNRIVAVDIHRTLLHEATALAKQDGLEGLITFQGGNAETLPFKDNSFDVVLSSTVMELLDADQMLREMIRVTRPGGRVGIVVRAVDLRSVVNLPLRAELKAKVEALPNGLAGERGCADASLYRRFREASLDDVQMLPQLATYQGSSGMHAVQDRIMAVLSPSEADEWRAAREQAEADGTFFIALPFHCAVGTKRV
jgi:SAM-dependent methyltransferase